MAGAVHLVAHIYC